jgi:hypothetical protein
MTVNLRPQGFDGHGGTGTQVGTPRLSVWSRFALQRAVAHVRMLPVGAHFKPCGKPPK